MRRTIVLLDSVLVGRDPVSPGNVYSLEGGQMCGLISVPDNV